MKVVSRGDEILMDLLCNGVMRNEASLYTRQSRAKDPKPPRLRALVIGEYFL